MYVDGPPSPVVIVTDWRQRSDTQLDISRPNDAPHVLRTWRDGIEALGASRYYRTQRIALFDYDEKPGAQAVADARASWLAYLERAPDLRIILLPTPGAQLGEGRSHLAGTVCFSALQPPDSIDALRLTAWRCGRHTVTPVFPLARRTKPLQSWASVEAMTRASRDIVLAPQPGLLYTELGGTMRSALKAFTRIPCPLAIDLEFLPHRNIVTAIGISDGTTAVSVPWHDYIPTGGSDTERGVSRMPDIARLVREVLATPGPKYFHNYVADVPRLERLGLPVAGAVCDTFAAHAIAYPELRHGLQAAAASLLYVPPWKSLYRPRDAGAFCRDDEEYWTASPECHRDYNAKDAYYTWHLAQQVLPRVGIDPDTGVAHAAA